MTYMLFLSTLNSQLSTGRSVQAVAHSCRAQASYQSDPLDLVRTSCAMVEVG